MRRDEWGRPLTEIPSPPCREKVCGDFTLPVWDDYHGDWSGTYPHAPNRNHTDRTRKPRKAAK